MRSLFSMLVALILLTACKPAEETLQIRVPACRPPDVMQGILSIGETRFKPYRLEASAVTDAAGRPALSIRLDDVGAAQLADITREHMGDVVPLRVDDETLMSPRVLERITDGEILVSGDFEMSELEALALRLSPACDQESPAAN